MRIIVKAISAHPLVTIWFVALLIRGAYVLVVPNVQFVDAENYDTMARSLLAGEGLAVESIGFVRPPLYAVFVALCYLFGGIVTLQVVQVVLGASTTTLIGLLARRFSPTREGVWGAALIAAGYPWFIHYVGTLATETLFTFFVVLTFLAFFALAERPGPWRAVGFGVLFGVSCLIRSNLLVVAPGLAALLWWQHRRPNGAVLFGLGSALPLAVFGVYCFLQGYGLVLASTGGGLNIFAGNSPNVALYFRDDIPLEEWRGRNERGISDPSNLEILGCNPEEKVLECVEKVPVPQRDRFFLNASLRWIQAHPDQWVWVTAVKLVRQWTPWVEPRAYPPVIVAVSGLSFGLILVLGLLALRRMPVLAIGLLALLAVAVTLTSVVTLVQLRYRFPLLDPALIAASGAPLEHFARRAIALRARRR